MKNLYLLFGFAFMGVLFFACQKDEPVVEEIAVNDTEMLSVERSFVNICCENNFSICGPCTGDGACCCRVVLSFPDSTKEDFLSKFKYCKAWDTSSTCEVPAVSGTSCTNTWDGVDGDVCVGNNFWCIPRNTGFSIFNTSYFAPIRVTVFCSNPGGIIPDAEFNIAPRTTEVLSLDNNCFAEHCE